MFNRLFASLATPLIIATICALNVMPQETTRITIHVAAFEGYTNAKRELFVNAMQEKYGVKVNVESRIVYNPADLHNEAKNGWADVLSLDHHLFFSEVWPYFPQNSAPLLQPIPIDRIENYPLIDPVFARTEFYENQSGVYGIPFAAGTYALAYNADILTDPPTSWTELWHPRHQGRYSLTSDYSECNIYITALAMGVDKQSIYNPDDIFQQFSVQEFRSKLNELAVNARSFWQSTADIEEMKTLALTTTWGYGVQQANAQGQNWKYADTKEGVTAYFDLWALSSTVEQGTLHYDLCLEWINFSLTPEIQTVAVREWGMTPVIQDAEQLFTADEIDIFRIGKTDYWQQASYWEILKPVTHHANNALWTYAMSLKDTSQDRSFVSQRLQLAEIASQGADRYMRGLRLAQEARQKRAMSTQNGVETVVFPESVHLNLTLYSLTKGMTKSEVIIDAVREYILNHPLEEAPAPTPAPEPGEILEPESSPN